MVVRDTSNQMQKQMGDALFSRAMAEYGEEFVGVPAIGYEGLCDRRLHVGVGEAPAADFGTCEAAYLYAGQRLLTEKSDASSKIDTGESRSPGSRNFRICLPPSGS